MRLQGLEVRVPGLQDDLGAGQNSPTRACGRLNTRDSLTPGNWLMQSRFSGKNLRPATKMTVFFRPFRWRAPVWSGAEIAREEQPSFMISSRRRQGA